MLCPKPFENLVFRTQSRRRTSHISRRRATTTTDNLSNLDPVPPNAPRDEILPQGRPSLLIFVSRTKKANRKTQNTSKCIRRYTCQDAIVCGCRNACYEYCVPSTVFSLSLSLSLSLSVSFSFSISISISLCPSHFNSDISLPLYKSFGLICFFDMLSAGEPCACLCQNVNAAVLC